MSQQGPKVVHVRIDTLQRCYDTVVEALTVAELPAAEITDILKHYVVAECLQCGTRINGEELGQIALAQDPNDQTQQKFVRLRNGYCARSGCESYYYRVMLTEHPKFDWTTLAATLTQAATEPPPPVPSSKRRNGISFWVAEPRVRRVLIGVLIVIALLVTRHFMFGGRLPLVHKKPTYTVDPASVIPSYTTNH